MRSDIETSEDLLGYSVHASLLKGIVSNEKNLPLTIGLYGDWGSGKSSILKILEKQLEKDDDVIVVYFDGCQLRYRMTVINDALELEMTEVKDGEINEILYLKGVYHKQPLFILLSPLDDNLYV